MGRRLRSGNRIPGWLILLLAGTLVGLTALPFGDRLSAVVLPCDADVKASLVRLRTAIREYGNDHPEWPGALGEWQFRFQLLGRSDATGRIGSDAEFVLGPYLHDNLPLNPATGDRSVLIVDRMPDDPRGQAAWIYAYETGEVRADTSRTCVDGRRYFDL